MENKKIKELEYFKDYQAMITDMETFKITKMADIDAIVTAKLLSLKPQIKEECIIEIDNLAKATYGAQIEFYEKYIEDVTPNIEINPLIDTRPNLS